MFSTQDHANDLLLVDAAQSRHITNVRDGICIPLVCCVKFSLHVFASVVSYIISLFLWGAYFSPRPLPFDHGVGYRWIADRRAWVDI